MRTSPRGWLLLLRELRPRWFAVAVATLLRLVPVVAMELLATGVWQGTGVLSAESFDPAPYLAILDRDGIHHATIESEPGKAFA